MTIKRIAAIALAALLAGCGASDVREVKDWMAQVKKDTKVTVVPIAEPKTFIPFAYTAREQVDPFSPNKLLAELARAAEKSDDNKYKPDMNRRKELLENFPLDAFTMVGVLQKGGVNYALLQVDRSVYQVKAGQRIGQNYGLVTGVSENVVQIKEVVQDAAGEWVERLSKLELQESKESRK
ncbi:pilus assembly protein PilP [Massilia sp. R2A-15]|uniref:pilus assembly protein PilP n=1 Tax=Massilia sp. R2A-15 TaxID=3064278 RepID=UPI002732934B|nr:pilus assembly protein PilP [Massilia sp. R2A-15]WLI89491.1 pilus assembly protein PilP [Massilia sp. R2A-15]